LAASPRPEAEAAVSAAVQRHAARPDALLLGVAFHVSAWVLLLLFAFWLARNTWFPALPWARLLVYVVGAGLVLMPWWRTTRGYWLILAHSLSLAALFVLALEIGLSMSLPREHEPSRYPYPYRMHGFAPNQRAADNINNASTNDAGLREPHPVPVAKPAGTLRILVLGGSAVFGVGAPDGGSAPAHLQRMLTEAPLDLPPGYERIEVINAGQGWYNSTQELVYFVTDLWRYHPDILLVIDGYNDVHHSIVWGVPPPLNEVTFEATNLMRGLPGFGDEPGWEHAIFLGAHASALRRLLSIPARNVFQPDTGRRGVPERRLRDPHAAVPVVVDTLLANWTAFDALAERLGFRVHFALQPVIYEKQHLTPAESSFLEHAPYAADVGAVWVRLKQTVAERAQSSGLDVFRSDTYVRPSQQPLFLDYCHMVSQGYARMAKSMADVVTRDLEHWQRGTSAHAAAGGPPRS